MGKAARATAVLFVGVLPLISGCSNKKANPTVSSSRPVAVNSANHPELSPMLREGECENDLACELTDLDQHTCCSSCRRRALPREKALALRVTCAQGTSKCPKLDCEYVPYEAKCMDGRCVVVTGKN